MSALPHLNHLIKLLDDDSEVVRQAVGRNLPIWFINHATASHGFDLDDSSLSSRRVIEHVLSFFRVHLVPWEL